MDLLYIRFTHTKLGMISRVGVGAGGGGGLSGGGGVRDLVTDSPCWVWRRGWTIYLLYGDPLLVLWFYIRVNAKFDTVDRNFLPLSCFYPCL